MSSAKEPVTFKLTLTLTPRELSLLQEGLEHNQITMITKQQQDNWKFIHEPMTIVLKKTIA